MSSEQLLETNSLDQNSDQSGLENNTTSSSDEPLTVPPDEVQEPFNPQDRILCPDGTCIGVIGPDGLCKQCGQKYVAAELAQGNDSSWGKPIQPAESDIDEAACSHEDLAHEDSLDLSTRVLCSDGACIGVIGPNGSCKVCGKPYSGETTS